jgi:hypothetical protein
MKFAKRVFLIAGVWGVLIMLPQYFNEGWIGQHFPPAINHPEYYYGFTGVTLTWQLVFLIMAGDPERYRRLMIPAFLEKFLYVIATVILFVQHRTGTFVLSFAMLDLVFAVCFLLAYRKTAPAVEHTDARSVLRQA